MMSDKGKIEKTKKHENNPFESVVKTMALQ